MPHFVHQCVATVNGQALPFTVNCFMQYSGPETPGDTCENIFPQYHHVELLELLRSPKFCYTQGPNFAHDKVDGRQKVNSSGTCADMMCMVVLL